MTTTIEEDALNTELQELYLIAKQWSADLQFIHDESEIIKTLNPQPQKPEVTPQQLIRFSLLEQRCAKLRLRVTDLQIRLAPLTSGQIISIPMSLIEDYQALKFDMEEILSDFHVTKTEFLAQIAHN